MNFIGAIQHATIGYGIRRRSWNKELMFYLDGVHLKQTDTDLPLYVLCFSDFAAVDWEAI